MKIWQGHGTEHSMNLKLIGHFTNSKSAQAAATTIESLTRIVMDERDAGHLDVGEPPQLFGTALLAAMNEEGVHSLGHEDIEQFLYDAEPRVEGSDLVIQTDEIDVIAFVKVLLARGARVEMYSLHDHEDEDE